MTGARVRCRRAFDVDLVAFVHDARGACWAEFREHYPLCADCSVEVRTWTELEIVLQGGAPPATTHPAPDDLLRLDDGAPALDPGYRRVVEYHIASCRPCADEIATLRAFDFTSLDAAARRAEAATAPAGRPLAVEPPALVDEPRADDAPSATPGDEPRAADEDRAVPAAALPVASVVEDAAPGSAAAAPEAGGEARTADEDRDTPAPAPSVASVVEDDPGSAAAAAEPDGGETARGPEVSVVQDPSADDPGGVAVTGVGVAAQSDPTGAGAMVLEETAEPELLLLAEGSHEHVPDAEDETDVEPDLESGAYGVAAGDDGAPLPGVSDAGFLPPGAFIDGYPSADEGAAVGTGGLARRVARALRHPAVGVSFVAGLLVPLLWVGELPRFPFGVPAAVVSHDLPEARLAVATIDAEELAIPDASADDLDEFPSALRGVEREELPPVKHDADSVRVALARDGAAPLAQAPGLVVPEEEAADPWALARLDDAGPVEIVAATLAAGLELEVPVPLTVPAGAVLQVQITGAGAREIVERLSFPGAREVALRVPAAWLVPGMYRIAVGVVRRGPTAVQVASYALVVH